MQGKDTSVAVDDPAVGGEVHLFFLLGGARVFYGLGEEFKVLLELPRLLEDTAFLSSRDSVEGLLIRDNRLIRGIYDGAFGCSAGVIVVYVHKRV